MTGSWIDTVSLTCAAGTGLAAVRESIALGRTGLQPASGLGATLDTWIGAVPGVESLDWPAEFARWDSRNNRLAWLGLQQDGLRARIDAILRETGRERTGLIVGTSTSSIGRTEAAYTALDADGEFAPIYRQPDVHHPHSTGAFLGAALGIGGPVLTVSTACSSSAKVFASADRWLRAGIVDAVVLAGVDSLCRSTLYGFESLQLIARGLCRPFDAARDGLNIGEAAAFAVVTRDRTRPGQPRLAGYGESCDAWHMSSPHPEGLGAQLALQAALGRAGLAPADIGYVNLHGTGTRNNDSVESLAMAKTLPAGTPLSTTTGWTGHTLGAAGLVEAVLALEALASGLLPANLNLQTPGNDIACPILGENTRAAPRYVASHSFGFGGNNCVLVFGRDAA